MRTSVYVVESSMPCDHNLQDNQLYDNVWKSPQSVHVFKKKVSQVMWRGLRKAGLYNKTPKISMIKNAVNTEFQTYLQKDQKKCKSPVWHS